MPRLVEERGHLGGHQRRPCAREVAENVEKPGAPVYLLVYHEDIRVTAGNRVCPGNEAGVPAGTATSHVVCMAFS